MKRLKKIVLGCLAAALLTATTVWAWPIEPRVTVAWDPNPPGDNVVLYTVYWGLESRAYTQFITTTNTTLTLRGFQRGKKYFFAATASTATGAESDYSAEIDYTFPLGITVPANFRITEAVASPQ